MDAGLRAARGGSSEAVPGQSRFLQELASAAGVENAPEGAKGRGGDDSPEQAVHTGAKRGSPRAREKPPGLTGKRESANRPRSEMRFASASLARTWEKTLRNGTGGRVSGIWRRRPVARTHLPAKARGPSADHAARAVPREPGSVRPSARSVARTHHLSVLRWK